MVSSRRRGRCSNPGVRLFLPYFQFLSGQLEAFYGPAPLVHSTLVFFHPGFVSPVFIPLIIAIVFTLSSMSLSFMSLAWRSLFPRFIICLSSCRPFAFCLATFYITLIYSPFELVRYLLYHLPSPTSFMLTSLVFIPPRCACVCLCFIPSSHRPGLIVILPLSLLRLVRVLFVGLVPYSCVSYHTHAPVFILLRNPALLIFASLHTPPLCLPR